MSADDTFPATCDPEISCAGARSIANNCGRTKPHNNIINLENSVVMAPSAVSTIETTYAYVNAKYNGVPALNLHGDPCPKTLIGDALKQRVESIDHESCEAGEEDAFFVADLGDVYRQHMRFKTNLPRVRPFYGKLSAHN